MENKIKHPLKINSIVFTSHGKGVVKEVQKLAEKGEYVYTVEVNNSIRYLGNYGVFLTREDCIAALGKQSEYVEDIEKPNPQTKYNVGIDGTKDMVNHPTHYGGKDNPMEVIKIIEHYNLPFSLGNTLKYVLRSDKKGNKLEDLKKAAWYLNREIIKLENVL